MAVYPALTAIRRAVFSRPIQCGLRDSLIFDGRSVYDHGCGRGDDIRLLRRFGYQASGWDPHYFPLEQKHPADIVNLGFVLNILEDPQERLSVAIEAFSLVNIALIIGVRDRINSRSAIAYKDGFYVQAKRTFQKPYTNSELKRFVESTIGRRFHLVGMGVGYVFRDAFAEQQFLIGRKMPSRL
jgi:DNA phosphorothioation-associated putative methyltransferase